MSDVTWEQAEREWNSFSVLWDDFQLTYPDVTFELLSATVTPDYLNHQVKLTWKYTAPSNQYTAELGDQYGYRVYRQDTPLGPFVDVSGFISALDSNSEPITEHVFVQSLTGVKHRHDYQYQIVTENILTPLPPTESQFDSETYPVTLYEHVQPQAITTYQTLNPGLPATDGLIILYPQGLTPVTFEATGQDQQYVVPTGVTSIRADVWGAGGGSSYGGGGGYTTGTINVTPGETLGIGVGEKGVRGPSSTIGYSPGGRAGRAPHSRAYHGGGLSGIFRGTISRSNSILIAGGGGGASGSVYDFDGGGGGGGITGYSGSGEGIYRRRAPGGGPTNSGSTTSFTRTGNRFASFVGGDGQLYGNSTGGGGGAGYWSGYGGQTDSGPDGSGGGGSGYISSDVVDGETHRGPIGNKGGTVSVSYTVEGYTTQEFLPGYLVSVRETQDASTNSVPMSSETLRVMVGTEYPHPMLRSYYGINNATLRTRTGELDFESEVLGPDGKPRITGIPYPEHVGTGNTYMQVVVDANDDISTFDRLHLSGGHDPETDTGVVPTTLIDTVNVGDLSMHTSVGSGDVVSMAELIADIDTSVTGLMEVGDVTMSVKDEQGTGTTMQHVLTADPHVMLNRCDMWTDVGTGWPYVVSRGGPITNNSAFNITGWSSTSQRDHWLSMMNTSHNTLANHKVDLRVANSVDEILRVGPGQYWTYSGNNIYIGGTGSMSDIREYYWKGASYGAGITPGTKIHLADCVESAGQTAIADETQIGTVCLTTHCFGHTSTTWEQVNDTWDQLSAKWQHVRQFLSGENIQQLTSDMTTDIVEIMSVEIHNRAIRPGGLTHAQILGTGHGDFYIWPDVTWERMHERWQQLHTNWEQIRHDTTWAEIQTIWDSIDQTWEHVDVTSTWTNQYTNYQLQINTFTEWETVDEQWQQVDHNWNSLDDPGPTQHEYHDELNWEQEWPKWNMLRRVWQSRIPWS